MPGKYWNPEQCQVAARSPGCRMLQMKDLAPGTDWRSPSCRVCRNEDRCPLPTIPLYFADDGMATVQTPGCLPEWRGKSNPVSKFGFEKRAYSSDPPAQAAGQGIHHSQGDGL